MDKGRPKRESEMHQQTHAKIDWIMCMKYITAIENMVTYLLE